jgi:hypothetical protein
MHMKLQSRRWRFLQIVGLATLGLGGGCVYRYGAVLYVEFVDVRGRIVPASVVEVEAPELVEVMSYGFPPLIGYVPGARAVEASDKPTRTIVRAVGFLPFDELVDARVSSEVVLQDDPNPVAECEGKCANEVACGGQGAGAGEDACVQACLADLALTGDDLADACRPLRVVQAYCLGLLTCDGFLAFERGEPNDCAAIPTAIADCEADVRSAASAARHPPRLHAADTLSSE